MNKQRILKDTLWNSINSDKTHMQQRNRKLRLEILRDNVDMLFVTTWSIQKKSKMIKWMMFETVSVSLMPSEDHLKR